jgi:iron-sulfur cluster assembly protein
LSAKRPSISCLHHQEDDYIVEYDGGFRLACDPKSLLYLFGMSLDYSDALIGGGFSFR